MNLTVRPRQQGAVLIVALIFLVILTMLGVTAMTGTTLELRMASNARDAATALQAAEAAVRDAGFDIRNATYVGQEALRRTPAPLPVDYGLGGLADTCNTVVPFKGLCRSPGPEPQGVGGVLPPDMSNLRALMDDNTRSVTYGEFTGAPQLGGVGAGSAPLARQPRYVIEAFCQLLKRDGSIAAVNGSPCKYYRITARGWGANPNTVVTVSEVFTMP